MSLDGIIIGDLTGKITYVNDALLKMYGTTDKNDLVGRHVIEFIAEGDRARATQNSIECLRTGQGAVGEFAALAKNGYPFPVEVTTAIIRDNRSKGIAFIDIVRDITERKKAEETLKENEQKYWSLFENMTNGFAYCQIILDETGKAADFVYLEANNAFERITGLRKKDVIGKKVTQAIPGIKEAHPELFDIYGKVALTGESSRFELEFKPLDIWMAISAYSQKKGYFAALFENITERKQLSKKLEDYSKGLEFTVEQRTKELRETQNRLLKAERLAAIGELAGMVGHDLRNPLTSIKNAAYFLRKKQSNFIGESGNEMLTIIDTAVEAANKIINDLLDYSREIHLDLEEYSPKSLIDYVLLSTNIPSHTRILDHTQSFPGIWVDASKMERVFINLIKNSIEAMPAGGTLEIKSRQNGENVEFTLADTGEGMSDDVMAKIFTPLFTTKAKGMGFGLPICKRIIEAHGGKIMVESALNKGTTFIISLPMEPEKVQSEISN